MTHAQFLGRLEDARLLTGSGCYASDWYFPKQAHAVFLRSDHAHAEIVSIDTSAALAMPGVLAVLTHADIAKAGFSDIPVNMPAKHRDGRDTWKPSRPILARDRVRYVGECVACIVAETPQAAQDALEAVQVEFRDLPSVSNAVDALEAKAPQLHEQVPGNLALDFETGNEAATTAAFSKAARTVSINVHNNRVIAQPLEPRACAATYDAGSDMHTLYCCSQGVGNQAALLVGATGLPSAKLSVVAKDVGGGFGARSALYPEYVAVLLAAKLTGRPVKWTGTRSEVFLNDDHARDCTTRGELALDKDGRFLAMRFDFIQNLGAYSSPNGTFPATGSAINCLTGVYDVPAAWIRSRVVLTNTTCTAAYRGSGRPLMSYILERLVDQAAQELQMDPVDLRRRNLVPADRFPYKQVHDIVLDCGDFHGVLDKALAQADWAGFDKRQAESAKNGKLRGRGIATFIEATGAGRSSDDGIVRFDADGTIALYAAAQSGGQGHETTFSQILSDATGLPLERFVLRSGEAGVRVAGNGAGGSRTMVGAGSVFSLAAKEIIEKGRTLAAKSLEAAPEDIDFEHGEYRIKGTDRKISLASLADQHKSEKPHPLDTKAQALFGMTFPNSCHIAEVEIDPDTGEVDVLRYSGIDDAGVIINHQIVEGQMHGGIMQGAGQVLGEHSVYDRESGQLLTGSFMDYPMPRATTFVRPELTDHPVPTKTNPLGVKGVGESGVTGSLPTVMNAIMDALRRGGVRHFDMPATPQRVWRALQEAGHGRPCALSVEAA